jgi:hypothetical protein
LAELADELESDGAALPIAGVTVATAMPTPSITANVPTRPTYFEHPITVPLFTSPLALRFHTQTIGQVSGIDNAA